MDYLEIGETSCFYDLMGRYELRGRVYVFIKIPNKGLQMLVCQLDKLMHNFKVYRDKFRAEYLQPKPRDEDKLAWLHRRAVIAVHLLGSRYCLQEFVVVFSKNDLYDRDVCAYIIQLILSPDLSNSSDNFASVGWVW